MTKTKLIPIAGIRDIDSKAFNSDPAATRMLNAKMRSGDCAIAKIRLSVLTATQRCVNSDFAEAATRYKGDKTKLRHPCIVRYQGIHYITDGHHRVMDAVARKDQLITVRIYDLDGTLTDHAPLLKQLSS